MLRIEDLVDDWRTADRGRVSLGLPTGGVASLTISIFSGPFVFDALYPVHARLYPEGAREAELRAVRIFEVRCPPSSPPPTPAVLRLPADRLRCL